MANRKSSQKSPLNRNVTIVVTVAFIIFAAVFAFTGNDYLGLFSSEDASVPTEIVSGNGDWWAVYFTNPSRVNDPNDLSNSIPEELINLINTAEYSIHIAAFEFDLTPITEALIAARRRGVEIQWVTDDENGIDADEEEGRGQFAMLEKAGIEVIADERSALMHNKFIIFDGQIVWTGSTNLTENGNFRNNNNVIVMRSTKVAEMFEREFSEMWDSGEFGPKSPSTLTQQSVTINGTPVQVFFAPEDEVISHLLPWIQNAQSSIKFMAYSFTHDDLGAAMLAQAEKGLVVTGIFETRGSETEYSELPRLYCAGLPVRQDGNPGTFHHKVIILDDEVVITGSLNFSENADDSNDENVVVITNKEIAKLYVDEFERRWAEAEMPNNADMNCK